MHLTCPGVEIGRQATLRWWCWKRRAGSNPVLGTEAGNRRFFTESPFLFSLVSRTSGGIQEKSTFTFTVRTTLVLPLYRIPSGKTKVCSFCFSINPLEAHKKLRFCASESIFSTAISRFELSKPDLLISPLICSNAALYLASYFK